MSIERELLRKALKFLCVYDTPQEEQLVKEILKELAKPERQPFCYAQENIDVIFEYDNAAVISKLKKPEKNYTFPLYRE